MRTANPKAVTAIFYISWIFIGNFILLNLFLAILLDSFVQDEDTTEEELQAEKEAEQKRKEFNEKERQRRLKKLGRSEVQDEFKSAAQVEKKKKKKQAATFTAKARIDAEFMIDDIDDLDPAKIKAMLKQNDLVKTKNKYWYKMKIDPQKV